MLSVATNLSYCWRYYRNHSSYCSIYIKTLSIQGPTPLNNEYSTYSMLTLSKVQVYVWIGAYVSCDGDSDPDKKNWNYFLRYANSRLKLFLNLTWGSISPHLCLFPSFIFQSIPFLAGHSIHYCHIRMLCRVLADSIIGWPIGAQN